MSIGEEIRSALLGSADEKYKAFQGALIPTRAPGTMIGVRTPALRKLAKEFARHPEADRFLQELPHGYYEEDLIHAFMVAEIKDFTRCMAQVERFLPYVDNWAVCDSFAPKCFPKHKEELFPYCRVWLTSAHTYTVRYALITMLKHFLTEEYAAETLALAASVDSGEYYINMGAAWLFAEAVAKCPDLAVPYLERGLLKTEVHNKAIQKAVESFRVPDETKAYLKTLKRKKS